MSGHARRRRSSVPSLFGLTDPGSRRWRGTVSGSVEAVAAQLVEVLVDVAGSDGQHNVVVTLERTGCYCQVIVDPVDGAWVEAQSNRFIADHAAQMTARQQVALADLGFEPADDEVPNHHVWVEPPVPWEKVAALLVDALVAAYGFVDGDVLHVAVHPHVRVAWPSGYLR